MPTAPKMNAFEREMRDCMKNIMDRLTRIETPSGPTPTASRPTGPAPQEKQPLLAGPPHPTLNSLSCQPPQGWGHHDYARWGFPHTAPPPTWGNMDGLRPWAQNTPYNYRPQAWRKNKGGPKPKAREPTPNQDAAASTGPYPHRPRSTPSLVTCLVRLAQVKHHQGMWESIPSRLKEDVRAITTKINPPQPDEALRTELRQAAEAFEERLARTVREHMARKTREVEGTLNDARPSEPEWSLATREARTLITQRFGRKIRPTEVSALFTSVREDQGGRDQEINLINLHDNPPAPRTPTSTAALPPTTPYRKRRLSSPSPQDPNPRLSSSMEGLSQACETLKDTFTPLKKPRKSNGKYARALSQTSGANAFTPRGLDLELFPTNGPMEEDPEETGPSSTGPDRTKPNQDPSPLDQPTPPELPEHRVNGCRHYPPRSAGPWTMEVQPSTEVIIIGDSNMKHMRDIPLGWEKHSFPGAKFQDAAYLIQNTDNLINKEIVVAVGINHRGCSRSAIENDLKQLTNVLSKTSKRSYLVEVLPNPTLRDADKRQISVLNDVIFKKLGQNVIRLKTQVSGSSNAPTQIHHDPTSIKQILDEIKRFLSSKRSTLAPDPTHPLIQ